MGAVVAQSI